MVLSHTSAPLVGGKHSSFTRVATGTDGRLVSRQYADTAMYIGLDVSYTECAMLNCQMPFEFAISFTLFSNILRLKCD